MVALTAVKNWPNNYTSGPFGIPIAPSIADPEVREKKLNAELANGRLRHQARAAENELGVQEPTGLWDPAGVCNDGDNRDFYRRRCIDGTGMSVADMGYRTKPFHAIMDDCLPQLHRPPFDEGVFSCDACGFSVQ